MAAQIAGVAKVLHADAPHLAGQTAENVSALVVGLAGAYSHLLLPATGSVVVVAAVAVLERVEGENGVVTTIVTVVEAPLASVPKLQTTEAVCVQEPAGEAETKVVVQGMVSETVTLAALTRPRF